MKATLAAPPAPYSLLALCAVGWGGLAVLFAGGSPPAWLLPVGLAAAAAWWWWSLGQRDWRAVRSAPPWSFGSWLVAVVVIAGSAAIAWGVLATPERSWDGFATWGLMARHLLAGDTLDSPFFADPAAFHYARGYPLLQPVLLQQLGAWFGPDGARLFYLVAWWLLLAAVRGAVFAADASAAAARVAVLGAALVPLFVEPGHGSAESGFADLLLTALVASAARALLAGSPATALCVGLLLPVTKNEGVLHLALWIAIAATWNRARVAALFAGGGTLALLAWLPVQQRLLHPGSESTLVAATFAPLLLLGGAWLAGTVVARAGTWARWALVAVPALGLLTLPGQLQQLVGAEPTALDLAALPRVGGELLVHLGWLRRFGATFPLLVAVALLARRERATSRRWQLASPLLLAQALFVAALVGFLLAVPEATRALFLREGLGRYLAHIVGVAWIASALLLLRPLAETAGAGSLAPAVPLARPRWLQRLLPPGSRRERCVWIGVVTARKLREGPGPWLRAVRKGVFQLLPLGLRNRILRWSGEEQSFRRHEPRHADADAGVERPGLVSVVLPVFNQADLLAASIDSVLAQSWPQLELIVIDDGSTDGVRDVLRRYAGDPRVRVLTQPNQGLPKALSSGFEFATGEFFTWTSADNVMQRDQLARLVTFLRGRPGTAMVFADYELIDDRGELLVGGEFRVLDRTDQKARSVVRPKRSTDDLNRYEDNFIGPCFVYRGRVGRLLGDYNPEIGLEDYDYWMRVNRLFRIEHLGTDEVLYRYRVHDNTLSARARELKILERARVLMEYERRRAAWVAAPLRVLGDAANRPWLATCVQPPDTLEELPAGPLRELAATKTLLVVDGARLAGLAGATMPPHVAIAAFFATSHDVHRAHVALRELPVIVFAADGGVASRLAVYRREVFVEPPGPAAFGLAIRYAANATFFCRTRDAATVRRAVPVPLLHERPAVLLQVDHFAHGGLERVVLDLATELLAAGHRVGLLALDSSTAAVGAGCERLERVQLQRRDDAAYDAMLRAGGWRVVDAHASTLGAAVAATHGVPFVQTVHDNGLANDRDAIEHGRAADRHTAAYACASAGALADLDQRLQLDVQKAIVLEHHIAAAARKAMLFGWLLQGGSVPGVRTAIARMGDGSAT